MQNIPLAGVHLVGGVSSNESLKLAVNVEASKYRLPVLTCPKELSSRNGAIVAWNAWELKNAEQDVDISDIRVQSFTKIPLGSFMTGDLEGKRLKVY